LTKEQLGPYQIEARIGSGGSAEVFKAFQPSMHRHVAIKTLSPDLLRDAEFTKNFQREAMLIAGLNHSHILPVFDYGQHDDSAYLVMPLMENGTIASRVRGKRLPIEQVIRVGAQVGDALHYAHTRGLVHRDVKPGNILLDTHGNCLLSDFGIAQMTAHANATEHRGFVGTPAYTAPEQLEGGKIDGRADQYALGIVLYELATGRRPFDASDPYSLSYQQLNSEPRPPADINPDIPAGLNEIIMRMLAKRPFERFDSMAIMVNALRAVKLEAGAQHKTAGDDVISLDIPAAAPDAKTVARKSAKEAARASAKASPSARLALPRLKLALPALPDVRALSARLQAKRAARQIGATPRSHTPRLAQQQRISARLPAQRRRFDPAHHATPIAAAGVIAVVLAATLGAQFLRGWMTTPAARAEPTLTVIEPAPATQAPPTSAPAPSPAAIQTALPQPLSLAQSAIAALPTETPISSARAAGVAVVLPNCARPIDASLALDDSRRSRLGCPSQAFVPDRQVAVQAFERGVMVLFARTSAGNAAASDATSGALYVLADDGRAWRFNSTWRGGADARSDGMYACAGVAGASPGRASAPWRHLGKVWCEVDAIREALGAAKGDEVPNAQATFQSFDNGRAFALNGWNGHPSIAPNRPIIVVISPTGGRWEQ
jgi:tRNA A-37 threonylcarbamoyl transferase component Bud32